MSKRHTGLDCIIEFAITDETMDSMSKSDISYLTVMLKTKCYDYQASRDHINLTTVFRGHTTSKMFYDIINQASTIERLIHMLKVLEGNDLPAR